MFYSKTPGGTAEEGRADTFPLTSSAARVSTISIGIDGVLSNHFSALYQEAVFASPSLLFTSSSEDSILEIAEGSLTGGALFRVALGQAIKNPKYYATLPISDAVTPEDFGLLDRVFESGEVAGYLVSGRCCLPDAPCVLADTRVMTQNWLVSHGLRHYLGVIPCIPPADMIRTVQDRLIDFHLTAVPGVVDRLSAAGVDAYLLDRKWNRGYANSKRVYSISHFLDIAYNATSQLEKAS